jgi:hypothetical protein
MPIQYTSQPKWFPLTTNILTEDLWVIAMAFSMQAQSLKISDIPDNCYKITCCRGDIAYLLNCDHGINPFGIQRRVGCVLNPVAAATINDWVIMFRDHHVEVIKRAREDSIHFMSEYQGIKESEFDTHDFNAPYDRFIKDYFDIHPTHPYAEGLKRYIHHFMFRAYGEDMSLLKAAWFWFWASFKPTYSVGSLNCSDVWISQDERDYMTIWERAGV